VDTLNAIIDKYSSSTFTLHLPYSNLPIPSSQSFTINRPHSIFRTHSRLNSTFSFQKLSCYPFDINFHFNELASKLFP
jgi:hypothetical protein